MRYRGEIGIHLCRKHTHQLAVCLREVPGTWADILTSARKLDAGPGSVGGGDGKASCRSRRTSTPSTEPGHWRLSPEGGQNRSWPRCVRRKSSLRASTSTSKRVSSTGLSRPTSSSKSMFSWVSANGPPIDRQILWEPPTQECHR